MTQQSNRELIETKQIVERLAYHYIDTTYKGTKLDSTQRKEIAKAFVSGMLQTFMMAAVMKHDESIDLLCEAVRDKVKEFTLEPQEKIDTREFDMFNMMKRSRD